MSVISVIVSRRQNNTCPVSGDCHTEQVNTAGKYPWKAIKHFIMCYCTAGSVTKVYSGV